MPERPVIADTGPLVAFLVDSEPRHLWAVEQFKSLPAPFLTCEPVLTETFHLLSHTRGGRQRFFELLERGVLKVDFELIAEAEALEKLIHKYQDLPMSLADACLVRMAEQHPTAIVFTLDKDFKIYRKHGRQPISVVIPE
ncbi:MAG TPA: PIN domain-containing protein [Phycisphaerae bacterium]|nr:PIN domain-containing protein [Phycisphaerae bacterium]